MMPVANRLYAGPGCDTPHFQPQGWAQAGLRLLPERGAETAVLGTSSNQAMLYTAQSVGFEVQTTTCWFSRPVSGVRVTAMR